MAGIITNTPCRAASASPDFRLNPYSVEAPAKINLFLKVTGKKENGYHEIFSLFTAITLFDTVSTTIGGHGLRVRTDNPAVPNNVNNIAFKAAATFFKNAGLPANASIHITKRIPVAAGLGGGSSNAATVLLSLNRLYKRPFSKKELSIIAQQIGADVPFFIFGHPAIATGIGDQLTAYPQLVSTPLLLVNPGFPVSTKMVFKKLKFGLTNPEKKIRNNTFSDKRINALLDSPCNDLEKVTERQYPVVAQMKSALLKNGAVKAVMTGSGPTVFGLFSNSETMKLAESRLKMNSKWMVIKAKTIS